MAVYDTHLLDGEHLGYLIQKIKALTGTKITDPATKSANQFLQYNGSTWIASNIPASGVITVTAGDSTITVDNTDPANPKVKVNELTLGYITDVTATAAELNKLHGVTVTTQEINYLSGVTSNIQTQLGAKVNYTDVQDNVTSTSTTNPLSANQGKLLDQRISALEGLGRFLSIWNTTTGLPTSEPTTLPYDYRTGDYYRVGTVGSVNYRPYGSQYTGAASTTVETSQVDIGDIYYYDGSTWLLHKGSSGGTVQDVQVNGTTIVSSGIANLTSGNAPSIPLSKISDVTASASEVNILDGATVTTAELNILDGATITTTELNYLDGVTSNVQTQLDNKVTSNTAITAATHSKITYDAKGLVTGGSDITLSDLGITASADELNKLDGVTTTTTELNYVAGTTANIQAQINAKSNFRYQVVSTLPATGDTEVIYLVLKATGRTNNIYTEYAYINNAWEVIGEDIEYLTNDEIDTIWTNN